MADDGAAPPAVVLVLWPSDADMWPAPPELLAVALPPEALRVGDNTVLLRLGGPDAEVPAAVFAGGAVVEGRAVWGALFSRLYVAAEAVTLPGVTAPLASFVPAFLLVENGGGTIVYARNFLTPHEGAFVRLDAPGPPAAVPADVVRDRGWLPPVMDEFRAHRLQLNNFRYGYRKVDPELEREHKFTLSPDADIWGLCATFLELLTAGAFGAFAAEIGAEVELWDFDNYVYEVSSPLADAGYVSFIPRADGHVTVKRKYFTTDQPVRREIKSLAPGDVDREAYLTALLEPRVTWGFVGSFRRIRFDVNFESLHTGHIYSTEIDRCVTHDGTGVLSQCEVEYLYSRRLTGLDPDVLDEEMASVVDAVRRFLGDAVVRETHESKLTFLRDHAAGSARYRVR